ncbi:MAG: U32 family peptidase [Lachnospiraceae bacterium]|nr:U32 family peptidase [Lachnospiraceae bacterium]
MLKAELLAPAGSLEIAKAVLDAGADAVYLAGQAFGARAYAANLSQEELAEIIDYAHMRNKKVHMTVNTLLKNRELEETLFSYIRPVYEHGLDAVIVQDFGVLSFLHRNFPGLSLHASTQMSVTTQYGAAFLKECGAERIVTARELTLEEIRAIYDATGMEIECFIHGALCYCYSGQCLMSSVFGGRSGNRGRCAQPCRLPYGLEDAAGRSLIKGELYPLSPKDLCAIDLIPALLEAGVFSFKIEGRMKQIEYAQGVTSVYRRYLDRYAQAPDDYHVEDADRQLLLGLGNRSGFTKGYYQKPWGRQMLSDKDSSHTGQKEAGVVPVLWDVSPTVDMEAFLAPGEALRLTAGCQETVVSVTGDVVQEAAKQPLLKEDLIKRLSKTGDSDFQAGEISVVMEGNCFLPVSAINRIRREALTVLTEAMLSGTRRVCVRGQAPSHFKAERCQAPSHGEVEKPKLVVQITKAEQLKVVLSGSRPDLILLDLGTYEKELLSGLVKEIREGGSRAGLCLPYCLRKEGTKRIEELIRSVPFDEYLVRSYDSLGFVAGLGIDRADIRLDAGVYVFSYETAAAFEQHEIQKYTMSYELNKKELKYQKKQGAMLSVYGRIPLMISAQCIYRNYTGCKKKGGSKDSYVFLKDRFGNRFFVDARCEDCYNIIYNNKPLYLPDRKEDLDRIRPAYIRVSFTTEHSDEIRQILSDVTSGTGSFDDRYTRGHFNRGVE